MNSINAGVAVMFVRVRPRLVSDSCIDVMLSRLARTSREARFVLDRYSRSIALLYATTYTLHASCECYIA